MSKPKPMLDGRELSEFELAQIRRQIEGIETIDAVSDEMRALIEQQWPHLLGEDQASQGATAQGALRGDG
jgi:hypothetical protein